MNESFEINPADILAIRQKVHDEEKQRKLENYRRQNRYILPHQYLFTGSSLMEQFPVSEYWMEEKLYETTGKICYNRAIGGYTTDEFLNSIDILLLDVCPQTVFLNIGTNDISLREDGENWLVHLQKQYDAILKIATNKLPKTTFYLLAYYPVNRTVLEKDRVRALGFSLRGKENLDRANQAVKKLADKYHVQYIDVNRGLSDENGQLKESLTVEGVHIYADGYRKVFENLKPYIMA